jgi:hypothetical protein
LKRIILLLVLILVSGCTKPKDLSFQPGKYAIFSTREQKAYIYDTLNNLPLIELNDDSFIVDVTDSTASNVSFGVAFVDIKQSSLPLQLKNWRVNSFQLLPTQKTIDTIPSEIGKEIITILADQVITKVSDNSYFGKTLIAIGPMRYILKTNEYYTFSLGANYVQVPVSGVKIEKVDNSNNQLTPEQLAIIELAVGSLDMEQYQKVDTAQSPTISEINITSAIQILSLDLVNTITLENTNVYIVGLPQIGLNVPPLEVYINVDSREVLGFGIITNQ